MKLRNYIIVCLLVCLCICFSYFIKTKIDDIPLSADFLTGTRRIYKTAKKQYDIDKEKEYTTFSYQKGLYLYTGTDIKELNLNNNDYNYLVKFNDSGDISYFKVVNKNNEIELGSLDDKKVVKLSDIKKGLIKNTEDAKNDLFEIIDKNDYSNISSRGYTEECSDSECIVTIYLGNVSEKTYFKVENVLNPTVNANIIYANLF